jgi:hypothetical protein
MPSGFVTPAASGGSAAVTARAQYEGVPITVNGGFASGSVTWDDKITGDALIAPGDLPATVPPLVTAGVYDVAVTVRSESALTAGKGFLVALHLDKNSDDAVSRTLGTDGGGDKSYVTVSSCYYIHAGGSGGIRVEVINYDSVARDFSLWSATIQRLS